MNCQRCNGKTKVVDCVNTNNSVIRRRKCTICGHSFYTEEISSNNNELKSTLNKLRHGKYDRKPISNEERKLKFIKSFMEGKA